MHFFPSNPSSGDKGTCNQGRVLATEEVPRVSVVATNYTKSPVGTVGIVRYCGGIGSLGAKGERGSHRVAKRAKTRVKCGAWYLPILSGTEIYSLELLLALHSHIRCASCVCVRFSRRRRWLRVVKVV